ncbi:MAG: alpha-mannosidase [Lachnospiraceae bacterium]|nr:alpha-mannosidase [Lachnospiraceae bacterium]
MIQLRERVGKQIQLLKSLIIKKEFPIEEYRMYHGNKKISDVANLSVDDWETIHDNQIWGGHREYFWFETSVTIPKECDKEYVIYELTTGKEGEWDALNPQFCVYINGERRQGFDVNHHEITLSECAKAGETYRIVLSAFTGDCNFSLFLTSCLKIVDMTTRKYYYDLKVPHDVVMLIEENDRNYINTLLALNESVNLIDFRKPYSEAYYISIDNASQYLQENYYNQYCGNSSEKVYCVGHTHIDCAWKWTLAVTEDKAIRSFSTVLELMRKYPEYIFMSSQPQLYQYVKNNAPDIYEQIRERVKQGRWETDGGMWVEADCNLSSGESLVRQFLHGQRFFREEFGKDNCMLWLPDVFGYSAALPQILIKCGLSYFMTTKINWNEFNKMPYDTFMWEGIDGTQVLTHFIPTRDYQKPAEKGETDFFTTYNGFVDASQVMGGWERYNQKYLNREVLNSFGYGDGGGGPTEEMLENQRRLAKGLPGCPQTVMSTARNFFETLEKHVKNKKYLPRWVGELYLEYHRGTYTSMARNKKYNRKSEFAFGNLESFCAIDSVLNQTEYPADMLHKAWEVILRNQFHDILPGSSIKEVYEDSKKEYEFILDLYRLHMQNTLEHLAENINAELGSLVVFWPNSTVSDVNVEFILEGNKIPVWIGTNDEACLIQQIGEKKYLFRTHGLPSKGYQAMMLHYEAIGNDVNNMYVGTDRMENDLLRIEINEKGQFVSIYDKEMQREVLKCGQTGNVIMTYEDRPHRYDAWDLNHYYTEKCWEAGEAEEIVVEEKGPVRGCLKISRKYLDSFICQYIYLHSNSKRIDIKNEIDWKQDHIFVKSLFPVDIHTDEAVFDIQFGNVKRPTHTNTSWDMAKFEVCMHKWLDVSEEGYGVALLTDCKYGCSVQNGVIGLSMLKSATDPNPDADKEKHEFMFSILPHRGDFREGKVIPEAYELNNPAIAVIKKNKTGFLPRSFSFASTDQPNVVIEAIKRSEDSNAWIIRLYECYNKRCNVTMQLREKIHNAFLCNLLEEQEEPVVFEKDKILFSIKPYEILTFKVVFEKEM